jgi:integrase
MTISTDLHVKNARLPDSMSERYLPVTGHENLCLRLREGRKDWYFRYRPDNGTVKKIALGQYPTVSLKEACALATAEREKLERGIDPQQDRKRREIEEKAQKAIKEALPQKVKALFDRWLETDLRPRMENGKRKGRKDGGLESRRKFEKDVLPEIGDIPPHAIRRAHIIQILDKVKERGAARIAGILLTDLRQMFAWAVEREYLETDPIAGMTRAKHGGMANERDRVLSEAEIKQLAKALPKALGEVQQLAVWIMLATACRVGEITAARWECVDFEAGTWLIPETKNGKPHTVSLSRFALDQFKALREHAEYVAKQTEKEVSAWVMPARHNNGCVCSKSLAKQVADRQRGESEPMTRRSPLTDALVLPGGKWTPHDLRRTAATIMASLNVRPDVIEKCLNHADDNRVRRTYNRHHYAPEMAEAWKLLGERLELLTGCVDNVVTLRGEA